MLVFDINQSLNKCNCALVIERYDQDIRKVHEKLFEWIVELWQHLIMWRDQLYGDCVYQYMIRSKWILEYDDVGLTIYEASDFISFMFCGMQLYLMNKAEEDTIVRNFKAEDIEKLGDK